MLCALRPGVPVAWLVVYEDGTSAILRDDQRSSNHAAGAHGIRVPLAPALPVRLYVLSASHSPLSHGARELVKCLAAVARRCTGQAAG